MPSNRPVKPDKSAKEKRREVINRVRGFSSNMRSVELLEKEYKKNRDNLTPGEKRLLDVITFEKTGKHIDEFKDKKPPKPAEKVTGHKLTPFKGDPMNPNVPPSKAQQEMVKKRAALRASESVS